MSCPELPLAFVTGSDEGYTDQFLRIVDLTDPGEPVEVGRWWYPGMHEAAGERPDSRRGVGTPCITPFPTVTCCTARGGMPGW